MGDDDWVQVARVDDAVVAEFLLRLKGVNMIAQPPTTSSTPKQALLIEWRVRQRRSKAVTIIQPTKDQAPRDSPSTPLSFSGGGGGGVMSVSFGGGTGSGASGSGGGGLYCGPEEESSALSVVESAPKTSSMSRSKVIKSSESNTIRRSKKKKTLIELKAEDEFLARERLQLQKELDCVRDNLEKERARNVNFKKIKLQHMESIQSAPMNLETVVEPSLSVTGCSEPKVEEGVSEFVLPDLNLPLDENC